MERARLLSLLETSKDAMERALDGDPMGARDMARLCPRINAILNDVMEPAEYAERRQGITEAIDRTQRLYRMLMEPNGTELQTEYLEARAELEKMIDQQRGD